MKQLFKRALSITVATSLCLTLSTQAFASSKTEEQTSSERFSVQIQTAQRQGLMHGYGNGNFGGNDTLTRAMWVTILENMCGNTEKVDQSSATKFTDIKSSDWFADGVAWAVSKDIVAGYPNGTFGAVSAINREELAQMAYKYAQVQNLSSIAYSGVGLSTYADGSSVSDGAIMAYRWCLANGVLAPVSGKTLDPDGVLSRAEAASAAVALYQMKQNDSDKKIASSKLGYAFADPTANKNILSVNALTSDGQGLLTTLDMRAYDVTLRTQKGSGEAINAGSFLEVCYNSNGEVITVNKLFNLTAANCWFDTAKYGAEFSPTAGEVGNMVASGWLLDKGTGKIVVGDTNRFEEEYALSNDVKVYEINTETNKITARSLDNLPVTAQTNGLHSTTPNRQMVVVLFDDNYKNVDSAKVTEIYYITPQPVVEEKYLLEEYDTMALYSYFPDTETGGVLEKPVSRPWLAYTEPFAIVEDKMFFVGDNDVACYLFNTDAGLVMLDTGWPACGYQYYLSIEDLGFDPREIKYILLSHGHGDHYGTALEFDKMINNAGRDAVVYETYEDAVGYDIYGYPEIGTTIPDIAVMDTIDAYYEWEEYLDFGGGVRLFPIITAGHTPGTGSFLFEITPTGGKALTFGYMGGFGTIHTPDQGYRRTAFVYGLRYLQQNIEVDYSLPQHMAHFPMLEINKAANEAGISFLEALVPTNDEWCNFLERRMVAQEMQLYHDTFAADTTIQVEFPDGTVKEFETQKAAAKLVSNENAGPWKREAGTYNVTLVDSGKLLHGFDVLENPNPLLDGIYNDNGDNIGDGVMITRDGYMHDPDKWFIQISLRVDDDYEGAFTDLSNGLNGPVESLRGEDWCEILRTVYFDTKADAEKVMTALEAGKTYSVSMDGSSNILLAENIMQTFTPVG